MKRVLNLLLSFLLVVTSSAVPASADYSLLTSTGSPTPYFVLSGLSGQSACSVSLRGTLTGTYAVEGIYQATQPWTSPLLVATPDGTNTTAAITTAGSYTFNCASMIGIRVDATAGGQSAVVTLNAGGGVGRTISSGVNGGKTNIVGSGPITVTNSGNTATVGCTGCGAGASPTPVAVTSNSTNVVVATPSPGVFAVSVTPPVISGTGGATVTNPSFNTYVVTAATPAPAATPVSVQAGPNVNVATPSAGVFVVSASTAAPPNITGAGAVTVATPAANTYVISAPTAAPAPTPVSVIAGNSNVTVATPAPGVFAVSAATAAPPSITSANTNLTVATPAANTYVLTVVTPAPAPTVAITTTNLAVTNPSTNVFTLSTIGNYTAPITSPTFGCDSYTLVSAGIYAINGSGYSCSASTSGSFVIPAVGSTVSVPVAAGFGIYQKYTPLTISDGTRQIAGIVSATTTATSTTVGLTVQRVNFGAVGNTVTSGAEIVTGGFDPGAGTVTSVTGTGNISTTNPTTTPVVSISNSPTFTGQVQAGDLFVNPGNTTGSINVGIRLGSSAGAANQSIWLACPTGVGVECTTAGVYGSVWDAIAGGTAISLFALDTSGDVGIPGYLASGTLTSGRCLQATTNGQISNAPSGCMTTYLNGAQQTGAQAPHIEQWNNAPTIANGAARTYTFATPFLSPPVCQAAQSAAGGGLAPAGLFITAVTTTSVTVNNGTGATQQALLSCIGL